MQAYLEIRRVGGIEIVDLDGESLTIGRVETNDVQFSEDDTVSEQHALLERHPNGWFLRDVGSAGAMREQLLHQRSECVYQCQHTRTSGQNESGPTSKRRDRR